MPAPLSLLSLLGAGSQGVVVAGGTHAAENLKLVVRRLQGECFRGSCLFHRCMKTYPHPLTTDSTSKEKPDKRGQKRNMQKTKTTAPHHSNHHKKKIICSKKTETSNFRHTVTSLRNHSLWVV
ncbi:uncharacterized protein LOC143960587 [Lithobates pipiens]